MAKPTATSGDSNCRTSSLWAVGGFTHLAHKSQDSLKRTTGRRAIGVLTVFDRRATQGLVKGVSDDFRLHVFRQELFALTHGKLICQGKPLAEERDEVIQPWSWRETSLGHRKMRGEGLFPQNRRGNVGPQKETKKPPRADVPVNFGGKRRSRRSRKF